MQQDLPAKKILIVNDDKLLLDMYVLEFKGQGFHVTPAFGGIDAIEKLRGGIVPDAILLDVSAPVMDSHELLGIIRDEKLVPSAKVIIFSNEQRPSFDETSRELGISGYVVTTAMTPAEVAQRVVDILRGTDTIDQ